MMEGQSWRLVNGMRARGQGAVNRKRSRVAEKVGGVSLFYLPLPVQRTKTSSRSCFEAWKP
jgi:hypothetical protein